MLRNYLKIAFRSLRRSKGFTALNIIGLAAGLGVCLLIVLYVTDELSYDRYNVNADRIYRVDEDVYLNNTQFESATISKFLGPALVASYPKIQQMVRFRNPGDLLVRKGNDHIPDHHFTFADSTIFKVFTLPMIAGDPNTALNNPHSIVIDASRWGDDVRLSDLEPKFTCQACGHRGADIRSLFEGGKPASGYPAHG